MGCKIECTICCKKKKKNENTIPIERKDTKFVAEGFQHLKIEIKNNNSNSKEIPLINNFFKETLGRHNSYRSKHKSSNSKSQKSVEILENSDNKNKKDNKNNKENSENKQNKEKKEIKNIIDLNLYKEIEEHKSEDLLSKSIKSENSKKTKNSNNNDNNDNNDNKDNKSNNSGSKISNKSNKTNKTSKSKETNKSKSKESNSKNASKSKSKESNKLNNSKNSINTNFKKTDKFLNSNNLDKSNEINKLIDRHNTISNNNTGNLNTSVRILNDSYIKKNTVLEKLTKISKNNSNRFKSNKDINQVFVDYRTFIKGKPYSELGKEYKQGIEIGEGGFGKVRTIIHKKTGQLRAMKLIKKSKEFNLDEIENLMLLNHPNILKLFEYYYDEEENIYIITEYIRGEELFNKIQEVIRFSEEEAAIIIKSVLQAIAYCHSRGIIHRDLKPENILIPTGSSKIDYTLLKIIDFGASVLKKDDGKISFRFGTPYYIAPEVLKESYNEKCDVWSIGVIFYLLLLGQAPFDGEDDDTICQKIISEEIDYEKSSIKALSKEAVDFMKKLLEKNPDKRISSSQALEHAWIKKYAPHTKVNKAFSRKIYKNLSNFREQSQLSTAVTTFITNYLMNDDELKLLKKLFFELDVKGVGVITRDELFRGMDECFGNKITREEVDQIFSNIDYDNNGTISFDEFVKAAIDKKKILTEEKLKAAFSLFDRNGDGDIEAKELKEVIGDDTNSDNEVWFQMIKEVDLDGNGVIDFDEFKEMMKKLCS
jgi:calcium-dependent protein kinase